MRRRRWGAVRYNALMKSLTEYLTFNVPARMGFVNITPKVEDALRQRVRRPTAEQIHERKEALQRLAERVRGRML